MEQAVKKLVKQAKAGKSSDCLISLPEYFILKVRYRDHKKAYTASFYPGAVKTGPKTVVFESDDFMNVLRFVMFCM